MKQILLTIIVAIGCATLLQAERYYVSESGEGQGTSWKDATGSLQAALDMAEDGDEIWVANGTYFPTQDNNRDESFNIPCGVKLFGGFVGNEKKLKDRDLTKGETILSGEIGDTENLEDNSYTIVYFDLAESTTLLNGFTISGAYADGIVEGADKSTCGGGVFINGDQGLSSPQISYCTFINNFSREGAAIYSYANEGIANPTISDCEFLYNRSNFNGGAIFNDGNYGICNPNIKNCRFEGNESMYGAGILNRGLYGSCKPVIDDCTFIDNFSVVRGGAIYNLREGRGVCEAITVGCVFDGNGATIGNDDVEHTLKGDANDVQSVPRHSGIQKRKAAVAY